MMRVATRTISGLVDGATTEELDELVDPHRGRAHRRGAQLLPARRPPARHRDRQGGAATRTSTPSASRSRSAHAQGIIGDDTAAMVATHARKLNDAIRPERNWLYEFFGLRTVYDRYLLRHPETRKVIETPQYFLHARGLRPVHARPRRPSSSTSSSRGSSTCRRRRRCSTPAPRTRRCRAATCSTRPRTTSTPSTTATATSPGCPSTPAASASAYSRIRSRGSLIRGTNGLSNGIVPWLKTLDSLGRRGQPGRPAQGRGVRLPRDVARRHRGVPRAARQHRRQRPPHPQPQPRQLGPRPVHGAGREGLAVVAVRPEEGPAPHRPLRRRVRAGLPRGREPRASTSARSRPVSSTAA